MKEEIEVIDRSLVPITIRGNRTRVWLPILSQLTMGNALRIRFEAKEDARRAQKSLFGSIRSSRNKPYLHRIHTITDEDVLYIMLREE